MQGLFSRVRSWVAGVLRRDATERDVADELRFHLDVRAEHLVQSGMTPAEARRQAHLEFGSVERYREQGSAARGLLLFDELRRNVRHALRALRRAPGFATVAILTLGLGIGANSAIFSFVNGLVLRPLPYPESDRLVWIATAVATPANLDAWRAGMRSLEGAAGFNLENALYTGRGPAERLSVMAVTPEFFPLLGGAPVLGRLWTEAEHRPGGPPAVVVRHRFWRTLGLPDGEMGRATLTLDDEVFTIVGVLPDAFEDLHYQRDVWYPAGRFPDASFNLIGLLREDASLAVARAEAETLARRVDAGGLSDDLRFAYVHTVNDMLRGEVRTPLLVLLAAAGLVVLIACANVANLLLARAAGRQREMTLRSALGAGRGTLFRQLITESGVLALTGVAVGLVFAFAGMRGAMALVPEHYAMGRIAQVRMDYAVLAFTLATGVGATLLAGLAPAAHAAVRATQAGAGSARLTSSHRARAFREALVAAEIALALVLVIGTLLLIRTFLVLRPVSPGFDPDDRLVASVAMTDDTTRTDDQRIEFGRHLLAALYGGLPGTRAALAGEIPLSGLITRVDVTDLDGAPVADDRARSTIDIVAASPNYFEVVGMRLLRGRSLADGDLHGSPPVAVVNETAALRFWPDEEPIGKRISIDLADREISLVVVGVARDTRSSGAHTRTSPTAFVSFWQVPRDRFHIVVHHPNGAFPGEEAVRAIVASVNPRVAVRDIQPMRRILERSVAEPRYHMLVMTAFGLLGVLLAGVGCYGVLSYTVAQRTREIGVRVALGASRARIVRSVIARTAALVCFGLMAGSALALALTRVLESSLYGVTPTDPLSFAAAAAGLALVSFTAAYLPARRAAAVSPATALAAE